MLDLCFQSYWRGYKARKALKAEAAQQLAEVRKRVDEANRMATEDKKLCNRTAFAIDYLYKLKDMADLIKAMKDLGENLASKVLLIVDWNAIICNFLCIETFLSSL